MFPVQPSISISQLATDVMKLSDYFIANPEGLTPWKENFCQNAYRNYFLPLNLVRVLGVIERGLQVGYFDGFESTIDWGAGPGTASIALNEKLSNLKQQLLIEKSSVATQVFSDLYTRLKNPTVTNELTLKKLNLDPARTLLTLSYSLTEMKSLPGGYEQFEGLMILEPATSQDGRRLLEIRKKLIDEGYWMWAPCPHQQDCPLYIGSKHDWCHDRFHVNPPEWFEELEGRLPIKNNTVTTSYILARKTKPTFNYQNRGRLVGDSLLEKGKTRQLLCRGPVREFLTWMHKEITPQVLARGEIIELPEKANAKSNELRTQEPIEVVKS